MVLDTLGSGTEGKVKEQFVLISLFNDLFYKSKKRFVRMQVSKPSSRYRRVRPYSSVS